LTYRREDELRKVLALSETEEAARKREEEARLKRLEEQNATALFDDSLQMCVFLRGELQGGHRSD
jgi:regulator of replication initiation timing